MLQGQNNTNIIQQRAQRVRQLRKFLKLSRRQFSLVSYIPSDTLRNWEQGRYGGLTEKGARKLVDVFEKKNVHLSVAWLLYGLGRCPVGLVDSKELKIPIDDASLIAQELDYFHQLNPDAVDYQVVDESMLPCFLPGDYVAGRWLSETNFNQVIGLPCLVKTREDTLVFGQLIFDQQKNRYSLRKLNVKSYDSELENLRINRLAPVLWIRRKGKDSKS